MVIIKMHFYRLHTKVVPLFITLFSTLLFSANNAMAGSYDSTGSGIYHQASTWILVSGGGPAIPGSTDQVNILAGHVVQANSTITVDALTVQSGGNLTTLTSSGSIVAQTVTVQSGGTIQGFDNLGGFGGGVNISNMSNGFSLLNEGLIRGGNPGGTLFISSANGSDLPCAANGASVTGLNGLFLGGNDYGGVYIVSETLQMTNALIEGGSGNAPNRASGPVYLGGIGVTIDGSTLITSGSNSAPSGTAGTVKIVASNCYNGQGTLFVGSGVNITVGAPVVAACPGVLLYAGASSTVLGSVGPIGAIGCMYWDPPVLSLAGHASLKAIKLDVAGDSLKTGGLQPGTLALEAQERLTISVNTLDLTGLEVGLPYFVAGEEIVINATEILLDEGVRLEELMEPAPRLQGETKVQRLSVTPPVVATVQHGLNASVPIQLVSVGNVDIDNLTVKIMDSQGWLSGATYYYNGSLAAGESLNYQAVINVPADADFGSQTELYVVTVINGGTDTAEVSTFTVSE